MWLESLEALFDPLIGGATSRYSACKFSPASLVEDSGAGVRPIAEAESFHQDAIYHDFEAMSLTVGSLIRIKSSAILCLSALVLAQLKAADLTERIVTLVTRTTLLQDFLDKGID